ncbi:RNA pseudouridine synthase [candidate division KSB1 bacterium]|nr:RNA pseudouridine synthase [candidate division KSB1 bacterium]
MDFEQDFLIYIDNHIIVVRKPSGMLIQGDKTGDITLFDLTKTYIKNKYNKPGNVYLGLVHRLDRPVSGIIVFARTSKAAARLNEQFRNRNIKKIYWALVQGTPPKQGDFIDFIHRKEQSSTISNNTNGQRAELTYRLIKKRNNISLVEIDLGTGRHHQIRVQFADRGYPILGDFRYGSRIKYGNRSLALHACKLSFTHPVRQTIMSFYTLPDENWPKHLLPEKKESI